MSDDTGQQHTLLKKDLLMCVNNTEIVISLGPGSPRTRAQGLANWSIGQIQPVAFFVWPARLGWAV